MTRSVAVGAMVAWGLLLLRRFWRQLVYVVILCPSSMLLMAVLLSMEMVVVPCVLWLVGFCPL